MKFLPRALDESKLMILRTYYDSGTNDFKTPDDVLDIVYKDIDTGKIYIETLNNPKIEIYVVKPQYRTFDYYKNFIKKEECDKYLVPYKFRYAEIGKILGCSPKDAKFSKYVYQIDMDIEHFYIMQFFKEYGCKTDNKPLTLGFSDIESDIIQIEDGFPTPGETPTNAISYFDEGKDVMYTLVCVQDNVPHVPETSKKYEFYEKLRERFKKQTDDFIARIDEFKEECRKDFEETYGKIDYKIMVFEDEVSMYKAYWKIIEYCQNDYAFFWNAPYDISNLIERPRFLGIDPSEIICSPDFGPRKVKWHEDKNAQVHKRKHIFDTYTKTTFMDQMVNYAGIRSGKGKLPSVKLNAIAKNELKDEKLDYSEYGNIKMFPYYDWWKFIKYNIKDVLLQVGIERKTHDANYIYLVMTTSSLKPSEVFTSTTVVGNDLRLFADMESGMVMGSNKNKLFKVPKTEEQIKEEKKDKFAGAFVMNPGHCSSTGYVLLGSLNKYIHDHAIDFDITSEYPTGMLIMNSSNETMVGKVYLEDPDSIEIKLYENMYIIDGDDQVIYNKTADKSNLMVEGLSENNPTAFGETFFHLPSFTQIATHIEDNIEDFI